MRRFFTKHGLLVLSAAAAVMVILTLVTYFSNNTDALTNVVNVVASPFRSASAAVSGWVEGKIRFAEEYDALGGLGWEKEGVCWRSADELDDNVVAILRQFNPYAQTGTHNYTTSREENDALVELGWRHEGIAWYGVEAPEGK